MIRKSGLLCVSRVSGLFGVALLFALPGIIHAQGDRSKSTFFLSGVVVNEEGLPVEQPVEVLLTCSGAVRQRVFSSPDGQFSFRLAENKSPMSGSTDTAGSPSGGGFKRFNQFGRGMDDDGKWGTGRVSSVGRIYLGDCEITAMLQDYASDVLYPGTRDVMGSPDVGTLVLRRRSQLSASTISVKSLNAPKKARKAYEKAQKEMAREKVDYSKVIKELNKAVATYPEYAAAWYDSGRAHLALGDIPAAISAFDQALTAEPNYLLPYLGMAEIHFQTGKMQEASIWAERVLERDPQMIRALYIRAYASYSAGRLDVAEAMAQKIQDSAEAQRYPGAYFILGAILETRKNFAAAANQFRRFLELHPTFDQADQLRQTLARWQQQGLIEKD